MNRDELLKREHYGTTKKFDFSKRIQFHEGEGLDRGSKEAFYFSILPLAKT